LQKFSPIPKTASLSTHNEIDKTQNEKHVPKQKSNEKFNALRQTKETQ
jgi:hypothetical protein